MISVSTQVENALAGSHVMVPRVTAQRGAQSQGIVSISAGSVTLDEGNQLQGQCTLTVPIPKRVPATQFDPKSLDVDGWRLFIEYCVVIGGVLFPVPLGTYVVYDIDDQDDGQMTITGYDTTVLLRDGRFVAPYSIPAGSNYAGALSDLCTAIGLASSFPTTNYTTPLLLFQEGDDRLAKMQDMASSLGWRIISDPYGTITARLDSATPTTDSIVDFVEGQGSHLVKLARKRTRQAVYNIAVVTGEPAGSAAPVYGIQYDDDPASPTYYLGPFGQVPVFLKSQYITSTDQATGAAIALLARKKGFGAALRIDSWPHPTLQPGDTVHVVRSTMGVDQVIPLRSNTVPLTPGDSGQLQTREGIVVG